MPFAASVLVPVAPDPIMVIVSVVMAMDTVLIWFTKVIIVPMGNATLPLAGIVNVRGLLSAVGCRMCLLASAATIG